ncbi:MAG: glutathione S-transferase family protein [Bacteroidota bacterium]|nr:glutathione S-transferase family protein [Kiloniellaceae bacterium]
MPPRLYYHPFSSFCQKVLTALYENATPFAPEVVDLGNPESRAAFAAVWPLAKFPVLRDEDRGVTIPESTAIIEYLALHRPGPVALIPADPEAALQARLWDRFHDNYVEHPMQKIVGDRLRPAERRDPQGVADARALLDTAYGILETEMGSKTWAAGEAFTLADCAAAPALFYAEWVNPFTDRHPRLAAYFERLMARPSFARVVEEAKPYRHFFPQE